MLCGNLAAPIELCLLRATTAGALRGLLKLPEASTRVKTLEETFKCFKNEFVHPVRHNCVCNLCMVSVSKRPNIRVGGVGLISHRVCLDYYYYYYYYYY